MIMRKIALFMDGWKRNCLYAWPSGILKRIRETNEEANLYIFNSFGNWNRDKVYNQGEYNVYNLPDLEDFDGIIIDSNNMSSPKVVEDLFSRARESGKPVVSLANALEGCYYAGIDNYAVMRKPIEHLYEEHGCRHFWFIMGPTDNYESNCRVEALKDYMAEKGLAYKDNDFSFGGFDYHSGVVRFIKMLEEQGALPDAVICANDNLAVGVCETAKTMGYNVPKDLCVTGFDNFDKAAFYNPSITTVEHTREEAGYLAADILIRIWRGEEVPRFNYTDTKLVCQGSCGCGEGVLKNLKEYLKEQVMFGIESEEFDEDILAMESEVMQARTIEEMMYCIPQCVPSLKCDAVYLILDKNLSAYKDEVEDMTWSFLPLNDGFCKEGYPETMEIRFAYERGQCVDVAHKDISQLFPLFDCEESGQDFLFSPLHFGESTIGFFVIRNARYLMEKQHLFQVVNVLTGAMEDLYKKEQLEQMNSKLSKLYIKDPLTGLYNRMGYQQMGENYFDIMHARQKQILIYFIDLDRLKYINDNFGHEYGDYAICATANAIRSNCSSDGVPCRIGGDEFVLVQSFVSEQEADALIIKIRKYLEEEGKMASVPFPLGISVGYVVTTPNAELSFEEYVKIADSRMYKDKMARRAVRKD